MSEQTRKTLQRAIDLQSQTEADVKYAFTLCPEDFGYEDTCTTVPATETPSDPYERIVQTALKRNADLLEEMTANYIRNERERAE
jgi:hypothetical protein